jgi:folate-binding protein YgfZ
MQASSTNIEVGYDALSNGVAILDRSHMGRILASGSDALDLINRFSTNETVGLSDGDVVVTVLTSDIGRVMELITIARRSATESVIMTGPGAENSVIDWLNRYNFGEDCKFSVFTEGSGQITISGSEAADLGIDLPELDHVIASEISGMSVEITHTPGPSLPSYEVLIQNADQISDVWDALVSAGATPASEDAFDVLRVEQGLPARSGEITDDTNPIEARLESYISFTKGCYMGQEVIARLDTYDKIQRRLVGLLTQSGSSLSEGTPLKVDDREIGRVTSVVESPSLGGTIALAYVRKAHAEPGMTLDSVHGPVSVSELPFSAVQAFGK